jgi:hypothetical protein
MSTKKSDSLPTIVATLSQQLTLGYGRGFAEKNLRRMVQFAEVLPDEQIIMTRSKQLGWSHFVQLLTLKLPLQREFRRMGETHRCSAAAKANDGFHPSYCA